MVEFKVKMEDSFGDMIEGWKTICAGQTQLDEEGFCERMKILGLSKPKRLSAAELLRSASSERDDTRSTQFFGANSHCIPKR